MAPRIQLCASNMKTRRSIVQYKASAHPEIGYFVAWGQPHLGFTGIVYVTLYRSFVVYKRVMLQGVWSHLTREQIYHVPALKSFHVELKQIGIKRLKLVILQVYQMCMRTPELVHVNVFNIPCIL